MDDDDPRKPTEPVTELYAQGGEDKSVRMFGININLPKQEEMKEASMKKRVMKYSAIGLGVLGVMILGMALMGWVLMLTAGAIFHEFGLLRPIGFLPAIGIAVGLYLLFSFLKGSSGVNSH